MQISTTILHNNDRFIWRHFHLISTLSFCSFLSTCQSANLECCITYVLQYIWFFFFFLQQYPAVNWISSLPLVEITVPFKHALVCFKGGLWTGLIINHYLASCFHLERSETLEWLADMPSVFMHLYVYTRFLSLQIKNKFKSIFVI